GEVLAEAGAGEEILTVDIDPARVAVTREQFPAAPPGGSGRSCALRSPMSRESPAAARPAQP
ncbi:hypothetical protein AB0D38_48555, partial [Streptomyces sp. NPDC048279]